MNRVELPSEIYTNISQYLELKDLANASLSFKFLNSNFFYQLMAFKESEFDLRKYIFTQLDLAYSFSTTYKTYCPLFHEVAVQCKRKVTFPKIENIQYYRTKNSKYKSLKTRSETKNDRLNLGYNLFMVLEKIHDLCPQAHFIISIYPKFNKDRYSEQALTNFAPPSWLTIAEKPGFENRVSLLFSPQVCPRVLHVTGEIFQTYDLWNVLKEQVGKSNIVTSLFCAPDSKLPKAHIELLHPLSDLKGITYSKFKKIKDFFREVNYIGRVFLFHDLNRNAFELVKEIEDFLSHFSHKTIVAQLNIKVVDQDVSAICDLIKTNVSVNTLRGPENRFAALQFPKAEISETSLNEIKKSLKILKEKTKMDPLKESWLTLGEYKLDDEILETK